MPIIGFMGFFEQDSYAESQKKKYQEIIEKVNEELKKTMYLDEQIELLRQDYNTMEINPDSVEGKLSTVYVEKENKNRQNMKTLCSDLQTAITEVKGQLAAAQSKYEYWCEEVEKEKQRARLMEGTYN